MSFVSDFLDDTVGLDPSGGGLWDVGRDVLDTADPMSWAYNAATGGNWADDVLGMDPNGGGGVQVGNAVAPLVAAYFTGGLTGLGDFASLGDAVAAGSGESGILSALSAGGLDSAAISSSLTGAGITSAADASAFGSALANSGWGQYLSAIEAPAIMGDVSTSGLFGSAVGTGTGLGDIFGTTNGIGALINGIGEASPTILGNTASGIGDILGTSAGAGGSVLDGLLNKNTLNNLAKAYKAFNKVNPSGVSKTGDTLTGVLNSILMGAELGKALTGKNGIDVNTLRTHDVVAPNGPNFNKAMAVRRSKGKA